MKKLIITMALVSSVSLFASTQVENTVEDVIVAPLVVIDDEEEVEEASLASAVQATEEEEVVAELAACGCGKGKDDKKA